MKLCKQQLVNALMINHVQYMTNLYNVWLNTMLFFLTYYTVLVTHFNHLCFVFCLTLLKSVCHKLRTACMSMCEFCIS